NLLREGVDGDTIHVTGNAVVDAMLDFRPDSAFDDSRLDSLVAKGEERLLVVTAHRRETVGAPLIAICRALGEITRRFPDTRIVFPLHPNPLVRDIVCRELNGHSSITLIEPVS